MRVAKYGVVLLVSVPPGILLMPHGARAQSAAQLQALDRQITTLQAELHRLEKMTARDHAQLRYATRNARGLVAPTNATAPGHGALGYTVPGAFAATLPVTLAPQVPVAPPEPALPSGSFRVGSVTVTLGGFAAVEGIYRSRNQAGSIATNFNTGIPLPNSPNYHIPEFRETAQQSRFSLLTQAQPSPEENLTGYLETDFLSAGSSSNSNESNSYTLRLRQFWGEYDNNAWGLHIEGGQGWSLATMYSQGLLPRHENVPLTIDAQYAVGFDWARQAEFRVVKSMDDRKLWAGFSVEEPQTTFSGNAGPNCLTGANTMTAIGGGTLEDTQCGGSNVNSVQAYSDNYAPDLIAKIAADPGYGHYELYGILSFLSGRVSQPGGGTNDEATGEGIGAGMILPIIPKILSFQLSGLVGQGVGRYGTAQLPDATLSPTGKVEPLSEYSVLGGFVAHPTPKLDVYAYGGAEGVAQKSYDQNGVLAGYGNPNVNLVGCEIELGSCAANTSSIVEGTIGAWYRFIRGSFGTMEAGAQYENVDRNTYAGVGTTKGSTLSPSSNESAVLISFRYLPFN
jgi:hypothetical protein